MKNLLLFIVTLISAHVAIAQSQCTVTIDTSTPSDTVACGECFTLTAVGDYDTIPLFEDFNNYSLGPGWSSNVSVMYNNPCGPPPDGSPAAWFGMGSQPREMQTVGFDVSCGGSICFEMRYETQGGSGNCEGPDLPSEGVHIQYSINGGITWVDIQYWPPNGGYDPYLTQWNLYCVSIPTVAETQNTRFRWYQDLGSGAIYDHWGIDNVAINTNQCKPYYYDWFADGTKNSEDTLLCLNSTLETYEVLFTNGIDDSCTMTKTIYSSLVDPSFEYFAPCAGEAVEFTNTTTASYDVAYWIFNNGQDTIQSQDATYTFPPGSNHDVELYLVDSTGPCMGSITKTVVEPPKLEIQVTNKVDVSCHGGDDGIVTIDVTGGAAPYTYSWTGSTSTSATADDLELGTTTVTVVDSNDCTLSEDIIIEEPDPLVITSISEDTIICIDDSVNLQAQGSGGSTPYIYTWMSNGQIVATGNDVYVTPAGAPTEYCVILGEQCGSTEDTACVVVDYPAEVNPSISPDTTSGCYPVEVIFTNTTGTTETIAYTILTYSDGNIDTIPGENNAYHSFGIGSHDVDMEVIIDRGCRYYNSYENLIEGYPYPEADFYVNPNPVSVFEPKIGAFSQSGSGIISYEWIAEGADPGYSSMQNPQFEYPNVIKNYPLMLVVENEYTCTDTLVRLVRVENEVTLFSPNTFTPDGDGLNDTWRVHILGIDVQNFHLQIFNRWGEMIFESHDPDGEWDGTYGGKLLKDGTYLWKIRAYDYENDDKHEFKGTVTILR